MKQRTEMPLRVLLIVAIAIGVGFRLIHLDRKIYWHDEVYTSMRAAGYTRREIDQALFQNALVAAPDLQTFQQLKPGSTNADTIRSLMIEDPQHPPLYFLMARYWMQWFGSSMTASRSLPAIVGLLGLPLMGLLALEVFASPTVALLATALLALSPFDVLFAQTARQYSLLTTVIIASSWLLLRWVRQVTWPRWTWYMLSVAIGLYVHPFFALTIIAHSTYILLMAIQGQPCQTPPQVESLYPQSSHQPGVEASHSSPFRSSVARGLSRIITWITTWRWSFMGRFLLAIVAALVLYFPWILVLSGNYQRASATTNWTRAEVGFDYLAKLWTLSFTALFNDIDFGFNNFLTYLFRLPHLLLILVALYAVYRWTAKSAKCFILTSVFVPFLLLVLPDLLLGGKRSAVSRYLIASYPGVQLAVTCLIGMGLNHIRSSVQRFWQWALCVSLMISIISCGISAQAQTWWNKDLSYYNAEVAAQVNAAAQTASPVVISDMGDDFTNMGDLISLSYELQDTVRLLLVSQPPDFSQLPDTDSIFVWRPSHQLQTELEKTWNLQTVNQPARLTKLTPKPIVGYSSN
ncbi:glycosyltransferase family 39 protein [Thermocoleostomius sinensis A174]|uniref:Glycosyltransferase family 39 protein n=2 Tax=Thermocoleostomius TaxID=3065395 RepID=A0A9E8ZCN1_9CYAN|nr:glycosyltransferase family 39 protein [Thermocoleostomius sinensis A174]